MNSDPQTKRDAARADLSSEKSTEPSHGFSRRQWIVLAVFGTVIVGVSLLAVLFAGPQKPRVVGNFFVGRLPDGEVVRAVASRR
jgi:uncharacterized ion transporter superfamily protein YfcC